LPHILPFSRAGCLYAVQAFWFFVAGQRTEKIFINLTFFLYEKLTKKSKRYLSI